MTDTKRTLQYLPLDRLVPKAEHARKTPVEGAGFEQLKASIAAHGLLENLLVLPIAAGDNGNDRYEVVAGARRLAALKALAYEDAIEQDHPVACLVLPDDSPVALICVVENLVRTAMHPADQFEAIAKHIHAGATVPEIAASFSVSKRMVEQWLRLGNAAPDILNAYRTGEIGLQCLKAFCVTSDTRRQQAVWENLKAQHIASSALRIRIRVTGGWTPAQAEIARFVGVAAYETAGGNLIHDIFAEKDVGGIWFEDTALLKKLALDKLEATAEELRTKWSWVESRVHVSKSDTAQFERIYPMPGDLTGDEIKGYERLTVRRDDLTELDEDDWNEDAESELERIEERLEELRRLEEVDRAVFRHEDMEVAGAIVTIGDDGTLRVIQGLVRPEDLAVAGTASTGADPASSAHDGVEGS